MAIIYERRRRGREERRGETEQRAFTNIARLQRRRSAFSYIVDYNIYTTWPCYLLRGHRTTTTTVVAITTDLYCQAPA